LTSEWLLRVFLVLGIEVEGDVRPGRGERVRAQRSGDSNGVRTVRVAVLRRMDVHRRVVQRLHGRVVRTSERVALQRLRKSCLCMRLHAAGGNSALTVHLLNDLRHGWAARNDQRVLVLRVRVRRRAAREGITTRDGTCQLRCSSLATVPTGSTGVPVCRSLQHTRFEHVLVHPRAWRGRRHKAGHSGRCREERQRVRNKRALLLSTEEVQTLTQQINQNIDHLRHNEQHLRLHRVSLSLRRVMQHGAEQRFHGVDAEFRRHGRQVVHVAAQHQCKQDRIDTRARRVGEQQVAQRRERDHLAHISLQTIGPSTCIKRKCSGIDVSLHTAAAELSQHRRRVQHHQQYLQCEDSALGIAWYWRRGLCSLRASQFVQSKWGGCHTGHARLGFFILLLAAKRIGCHALRRMLRFQQAEEEWKVHGTRHQRQSAVRLKRGRGRRSHDAAHRRRRHLKQHI